MWKTLALAVLLAPNAAGAAGLGGQAGTYKVEYTGYSHGFVVLRLAGSLDLTPSGYALHVTFHTAGMAAWVVRADNDSQVSGRFAGDQAMPILFEGSGSLRGTRRLTRIAYQDGNPVIQTLSPPVEHERSAVPPSQTQHTIDTLSAVALLIHEVAMDGKCEGTATTFDGRRLRCRPRTPPAPRRCRRPAAPSSKARRCAATSTGASSAASSTNENEDDLKQAPPRYRLG